MEWLSQNWIWVVFIIGIIWLLSRSRHGGVMGGCGSHGMAHEGPAEKARTEGGDASRPPAKDAAAIQPAERSPHRHGRGGCC